MAARTASDQQDMGEQKVARHEGDSRIPSLLGRIAYAPVLAFVAAGLVAICLLAAGILGVPAMTPEKPGSEPFRLLTLAGGPVRAAIVLSTTAAAIALAALLPRLSGRLSRIPAKRTHVVVAVEFALLLAAQAVFVTSVSATDYMWGDAHLLRSWAARLLEANPHDPLAALATWSGEVFSQPSPQVMDTAPAYLAAYPYQSEMLLLYMAATQAFGNGAVIATQWLNVASNMVSAACLVWLAGRAAGERHAAAARMAAGGLLLLCAPLCLLVLYSYGNWPGLALALAYLVTRILAWDGKRRGIVRQALLTIASAVLLSASLAIKSTFVLLALGCVAAEAIWALVSDGTRPLARFGRVAAGGAALAVALALSKMPQDLVIGKSGIPADREVPSVSFVAMGLARADDAPIRMYADGSDSLPAPGWYDASTTRRWSEANGDENVQREASMQAIRGEFEGAGIIGMAKRLAWKVASEWAQGDFQGFFLSACCVDSEGQRVSPMVSENGFDRIMARGVLAFADVQQLLVYLLATSMLIPAGIAMLRGRSGVPGHVDGDDPGLPVTLLVTCVMLCGMGCYLLWEAKPVYVFPFFLMLVIPAATRIGSGWGSEKAEE